MSMKLFYNPVAFNKAIAYNYISTNTTTIINSGETKLIGVVVNSGNVSGVTKLYDGIDATGTLIATIVHPIAQRPSTLFYYVDLTIGLTAVTTGSGTPKITILYA